MATNGLSMMTIKPLTTEPSLEPPVTPGERKDVAEYNVFAILKKLRGHLLRDDEVELEIQNMACQAEDDEIDRDMYGEDGSLNPASFDE